MIKKLMNFFKDEEGATMVEYGIMVALIAVASIAIVGDIGDRVAGAFDAVLDALVDEGVAVAD